MIDTYVQVNRGWIGPIYGEVDAATGTFTLSTLPKCSLYDSTGTVLAAFNNINASNFESGAGAGPKFWLVLDTTLLPNPMDTEHPDTYKLIFLPAGTGSDGIARTEPVVIEIEVQREP